jgi:hypothetical protein
LIEVSMGSARRSTPRTALAAAPDARFRGRQAPQDLRAPGTTVDALGDMTEGAFTVADDLIEMSV